MLSPPFAHSSGCQRIVESFWKSARDSGQFEVDHRSRLLNVIKTPDSILEAQLKAWDKVIEANKDPFFVKVLNSQKAWAKRVSPYFLTNNLTTAQLEVAYKHFFG